MGAHLTTVNITVPIAHGAKLMVFAYEQCDALNAEELTQEAVNCLSEFYKNQKPEGGEDA